MNLILLLLMTLVASCSQAAAPQTPQQVVLPPVLESPLSELADLSRSHSAYSVGDRERLGSQFAAHLPHSRVTALDSRLLFEPEASGLLGGEHAYALFAFSLPQYLDESTVALEWVDSAPGWLWVGLGNWETGRWDWHEMDGAVLELGDGPGAMQPYRAEDGLTLVAVLAGGHAQATLAQLQLGDRGWLRTLRTDTLTDDLLPLRMAAAEDGVVVLAYSDSNWSDGRLLKFGHDGQLQWSRQYQDFRPKNLGACLAERSIS